MVWKIKEEPQHGENSIELHCYDSFLSMPKEKVGQKSLHSSCSLAPLVVYQVRVSLSQRLLQQQTRLLNEAALCLKRH